MSLDWDDARQVQIGDATAMHEGEVYNYSVRSYALGLVFAPLAIKWPESRHLLLLRVDGGITCYGLHRRYQGHDDLGTHQNAVFIAGYGVSCGVELSYSYRIWRYFSLGAYANLRIMPHITVTGGVVLGIPVPIATAATAEE